MIHLDTDIEGKQMYFGQAQKDLKKFGLFIGGNWEYDSGMFDGIVHRDDGETIYIRLPFQVIDGELDHKNALIEFEKPFIIKHVVNIGLDKDENSLLTVTGFAQFQEPKDKDGYIHNKSKWEEFGEELVGDILDKL
ncbi:YugN family protein [Pseudogracilibacillus sp. SO30301A]|uniref:YugN family protein n=1 Tax=Pseudogracilibacillus sp. SO30301A TaxID=3098291 RepID=UPI00300DC069